MKERCGKELKGNALLASGLLMDSLLPSTCQPAASSWQEGAHFAQLTTPPCDPI